MQQSNESVTWKVVARLLVAGGLYVLASVVAYLTAAAWKESARTTAEEVGSWEQAFVSGVVEAEVNGKRIRPEFATPSEAKAFAGVQLDRAYAASKNANRLVGIAMSFEKILSFLASACFGLAVLGMLTSIPVGVMIWFSKASVHSMAVFAFGLGGAILVRYLGL